MSRVADVVIVATVLLVLLPQAEAGSVLVGQLELGLETFAVATLAQVGALTPVDVQRLAHVGR